MKRLLVILFGVAVIAGCSKENSDNFYPYPVQPKDTVWTAALQPNAAVLELEQMLQTNIKTDSLFVSNGGILVFNEPNSKMILSFPGNFAIGAGGATLPPNAKVKIQAVHLDSKGDMIRFARPTTSFNRLLVTGGAAFVKATYEGNEVSLAPGKKYEIRLSNNFTSNPQLPMALFYGNENSNLPNSQSTFTWQQAFIGSGQPIMFSPWYDSTNQTTGYSSFPEKLRWVNCDYFYDTTLPKTMITAYAASQYTNANTAVYAVFKNLNIVIRMNTDAMNRIFYQHNMPIGQQVRLVSISKINDKLYLGTKDVTIAAGLNVKLEPAEKTKQEIETFLDSL